MTDTLETPQAAARRLSAGAQRDGFIPAALHAYTDADGQERFWRIRLKHPQSGEKWIRPMQFDGSRYTLGEPETPAGGKPLYRLHQLATRPDDAVVVTEGELKADRLAQVGLLVTTSGGADSAGKADWEPLARREVLIWPDNDEAGHRYAAAVAEILDQLGCTVRVLNVAEIGLEAKEDAADWLLSHPEASYEDVLALPWLPWDRPKKAAHAAPAGASPSNSTATPPDDEDGEGKKPSQASLLVAFVEEHAVLFHDENADVYVQTLATKETRRLDSRQFRDWLVASYYAATGKSPREQSVREALSTLAGLGRYRGERSAVHVRVGQHDGAYYLDLGEPGQSRVVKIEAGRWEIVGDAPVRFVRPETLQPLPEPRRGGSLATLWRLVNIPEDSRLLVLAWLAECLRPDTPFPLLELIGEQGSAKSSTQAMLRRLIDPNACDLRAAPKDVQDVFVGAGVNWLVSYENISHLSSPMQDAMCVLSTGGGFAKRKLYSDAEESVIRVKRPIVLNGISVAITAQDLIDRTMSVETPVIRERTEGTQLWESFQAEHPFLLGALLDATAGALAHLPDMNLPPEQRPRLVEFARLGMAIALTQGRPAQEFMDQFSASRQESIARTIDASPVATALIEWFDERDRRAATLSVKELYRQVDRKKTGSTDAWPRTAKGFGDALRRAAPALRLLGIECRSLGKVGGTVRWVVERREELGTSCPERPASPGHCAGAGWEQDFRTFRTSPATVTTGAVDHDLF